MLPSPPDSFSHRLVQTLWLPVLLLLLWQFGATHGWVHPFFFPPPTTVLTAAWGMTRNGELPRELAATLRRYAMGVSIGCICGIGCGLLMGLVVPARRALEPLVAALYSTPKLALLPLVMLLLGIGDVSKVALISLVGFIFLSTQTHDAIRSVDPGYVESARNHRAGNWAVVKRIYWPAALPQIFTGLRMALTRSFVVAISAELVSGVDGVGAMIWMAWATLATERLYVGIVLAAALGISVHWTLLRVERTLVPWRKQSG